MVIVYGTTRCVLLLGNVALKIPSISEWRLFLLGLLANMQEREFSKTDWPELCPVMFSIPGGWLVVMRRAAPLLRHEWDALDVEKFANKEDYRVPVEDKVDSFGWLDGRIVAVDYGS